MLKLLSGSTRALIVAQVVLSVTLQTAFCDSEMEREENIPRPSGSTVAPEPSISPIKPGVYNGNAPSGALSSRNQGEQVLLGHVGDEKHEVSSIRGDQGASSQGTFTHAFNGDVNSLRQESGSNGMIGALKVASQETKVDSATGKAEPTQNAVAAKTLLNALQTGDGNGEHVLMTARVEDGKITKVNVISVRDQSSVAAGESAPSNRRQAGGSSSSNTNALASVLKEAGLSQADVGKVLKSPAGRDIATNGSPAVVKTFVALVNAAKDGAPMAFSTLADLAKNGDVQSAVATSPVAGAKFAVTLAKTNLSPAQVGAAAQSLVEGKVLTAYTGPMQAFAMARFAAPLLKAGVQPSSIAIVAKYANDTVIANPVGASAIAGAMTTPGMAAAILKSPNIAAALQSNAKNGAGTAAIAQMVIAGVDNKLSLPQLGSMVTTPSFVNAVATAKPEQQAATVKQIVSGVVANQPPAIILSQFNRPKF